MRDVTVPIYLLPGNHDPLDAASIYRSQEFTDGCPAHVYVLDTPGRHVVREGVEIVAAPWFSKAPLSDLVADALADIEPSDSVVRIVAGHGSVLGIDRHNPAGISEPALSQAIAEGKARFAVLGDRHSTTQVTDGVWYPGAPEVTSRREDDPGNVLVVTIDDAGVSVDTVGVGLWAFVHHHADLTSSDDVDQLAEWLAAQPAKERTAVWLSLTGTLSVGSKARLDEVIDQAGDLYALIEFWDRHTDLAVLPEDNEFTNLGLSGFAQDAVDDLVALLQGEQSDAARDALGLLYRLSGGGR
jgi:DNA repair exonuclease SbcCD nuclease subunit